LVQANLRADEPATRPFDMGTICWLPYGRVTPQPLIDRAVQLTLDASDHLLVQLPWSPEHQDLADQAAWIAGIARDNHRRLTIAVDWQEPRRQDVLGATTRPWRFADPAVRDAFLRSVAAAAERFHPDYFVLAVEVNYYARTHPGDFRAFVEVFRAARGRIRQSSPDTRVLVTFQYELLSGKDRSWKVAADVSPVQAFGDDLDVVGIATYPHLAGIHGAELTSDYFSTLDKFGNRPWGIFETSWPTIGGDAEQAEYLRRLLAVCRDRSAKVLIWTGTVDSAGTGWMDHLGLFTSAGEPKRAVEEWKRWGGMSHP
jgi:hypothetical protein